MKRYIHNLHDRAMLVKFIQQQDKPMTVTIEKGIIGKRSIEQNRLQRLWLSELAEQGDMTAEEYRGYCKLHFGVPIMRNANAEFKQGYDRLVKDRFDYGFKLELMMMPFDFPVTRLMTLKQKQQYLDAIFHFFTSKGFKLAEMGDE
ncbi:hypothetical protein [Acinetobacter sp. c3-l95]|uniref:hypothetical protein n=1 Tax=Acinetobacter sp. c3-l95 TaxID=3342804 RepID=UPI0035B7346A